MKKHIHHIFWFWLPPLGYMAAIFFVSSLPNPQIGGDTPDYVLHALEYFLLTLLLIRLFLSSNRDNRHVFSWQYACVLGVIVAVSYGVTDEIHQYFIPGRHCSVHDVVSDMIGSIVAYGVASLDALLFHRYKFWQLFLLKRLKPFSSVSYAIYRSDECKRVGMR